MYAGKNNDQTFRCGIGANYQGIIMNGATPKYYYAINRNSGEMRVCEGLASRLGDITNPSQLGTSCTITQLDTLSLRENEYYGAVEIINFNGGIFGIVSIRTKGTGLQMRQAFVDFGKNLGLPTFDNDTYYYTVSGNRIWRLPQRWGIGGTVRLAYFAKTQFNRKSE